MEKKNKVLSVLITVSILIALVGVLTYIGIRNNKNKSRKEGKKNKNFPNYNLNKHKNRDNKIKTNKGTTSKDIKKEYGKTNRREEFEKKYGSADYSYFLDKAVEELNVILKNEIDDKKHKKFLGWWKEEYFDRRMALLSFINSNMKEYKLIFKKVIDSFIKEKDISKRRLLALAIGFFDSEYTRDLLIKEFKATDNSKLKITIMYALAQIKDSYKFYKALLNKIYKSGSFRAPDGPTLESRVLVVRLTDPTTWKFIYDIASDFRGDTNIRVHAIDILGKSIKDWKVRSLLMELALNDKNPKIRKEAVLQLRRTDEFKAEEVVKRIIDQDEDTYVRIQAIMALRVNDNNIDYLKNKFYNFEKEKMKKAVLFKLDEFTHKENVVDFLIDVFEDERKELSVTMSAADALFIGGAAVELLYSRKARRIKESLEKKFAKVDETFKGDLLLAMVKYGDAYTLQLLEKQMPKTKDDYLKRKIKGSIKELNKKLNRKRDVKDLMIKFKCSRDYKERIKLISRVLNLGRPNRKMVEFFYDILNNDEGGGYEILVLSAAQALYSIRAIIKKRFPNYVRKRSNRLIRWIDSVDKRYIKTIVKILKPFCKKEDIPSVRKAILKSESRDEAGELIKILTGN